MPQQVSDAAAQATWDLALASSALAGHLARRNEPAVCDFDALGRLRVVESAPGVIAWRPGSGWELPAGAQAPGPLPLELYLPICSATTTRPLAIGHLGQSLDGFIATRAGESQYVTGDENIRHLHRIRALCDAVIVGSGTVAADNPQLTVRHVPGPNPLRVVFDPSRRLTSTYRVFSDDEAPTLYACAGHLVKAGETHVGRAEIVGLEMGAPGAELDHLTRILHARGCCRIFVEGGGVTVSSFLAAGLLDRLHVAIAPVIIGDGRPAIRLPAPARLRDCARPRYRVFRMGGDILFDCELKPDGVAPPASPDMPPVFRVI